MINLFFYFIVICDVPIVHLRTPINLLLGRVGECENHRVFKLTTIKFRKTKILRFQIKHLQIIY